MPPVSILPLTSLLTRASLLSIVLGMTACESTNPPLAFVPVPAADERAVLYVYRPGKMANAIYSPDLYIDGEQRGVIASGRLYRYNITAGHHDIKLAPDQDYAGNRRIEFVSKTGDKHFLRIDTTLQIAEQSAGYSPYIRTFEIVRIDEEDAVLEIARCCNRKKELDTAATTDLSPGEGVVEEGFSSDRTHDPFRHGNK